jgi:hypothetical protein
MRGGSPINSWMFIQKPLERRGRDRRRRTPTDFPLLQCGKFGRHAGGSESADRIGLAEIIGLTPRLQAENDRRERSLRWRAFVLLGKEPFQGRSCNRLRRGTRSFPLLKRADLYWQTGVPKRANRLRLTKTAHRSPSFEFYDHGMKRLVCHQSDYDDHSTSHWQLVDMAIWEKGRQEHSVYRLFTYSVSVHNGSGRLIEIGIGDTQYVLWKRP